MKFASTSVYLLLIIMCVLLQKTIVYPNKLKRYDDTLTRLPEPSILTSLYLLYVTVCNLLYVYGLNKHCSL